jgi:hypothetical protein
MDAKNADRSFATCRETKKEEFPGHMEDMLPGNSFPRSALFLVSSLPIDTIERNGTQG